MTQNLPLRVVSLLPSATENFCALIDHFNALKKADKVLKDQVPPILVGRSHECDAPKTSMVINAPVLTSARTHFTNSADVHNQVRIALQESNSLYRLDSDLLQKLHPDVILMQSECRVCSIDLQSVEQGIKEGSTTKIVTLNPISLEDTLGTQFREIGEAIGLPNVGESLGTQNINALHKIRDCVSRFKLRKKKRVLIVEWLDPLCIGKDGWVRELVECAGGEVVTEVINQNVENANPVDIVIVALCGLSLQQTEKELQERRVGAWWSDIGLEMSVLNDKQPLLKPPTLYIVDGLSMFTRPTQRLLTALEWLVSILHEPNNESELNEPHIFARQFDLGSSDTQKSVPRPPDIQDIEEIHLKACVNQQTFYKDPNTGFSVLTEYYLQSRKMCCGNGCRHCPYGHINVKDPSKKTQELSKPALIIPSRRSNGDWIGSNWGWKRMNLDIIHDRHWNIMFWSGGKDSFLALNEIMTLEDCNICLLTTIDPNTEIVPVQGIPAKMIISQANALQIPLCLAPVKSTSSYKETVMEALKSLKETLPMKTKGSTISLVFGDLHLNDIRKWRENAFQISYPMKFPIYNLSYKTYLIPKLEELCNSSGTVIRYSAVESALLHDANIQKDTVYDWKVLETLQGQLDNSKSNPKVDLMGECGEFHTCVYFPGMKQQ